jgi:hypothetical protein
MLSSASSQCCIIFCRRGIDEYLESLCEALDPVVVWHEFEAPEGDDALEMQYMLMHVSHDVVDRTRSLESGPELERETI